MGRENIYNHNFDPKNLDPGLNFNHRVRDAAEFQAAANHFKEFGTYTKYPENDHPKSRYMKFWKEQKRRSIEGYHIGRDWIPGYFYFYLNFSQIPVAKSSNEADKGKKRKGFREITFPDFWDYDYYYFHYLEEAEKAGEHASVLKSRGKGYSNKAASMCNRNFHLIPGSLSYMVASDKGYLTGRDGLMTKFDKMRSFISQNTPYYKHSHKISKADHKRASYIEKIRGREIEGGIMSEVSAISLRNNPDAIRGIRGKLILYEEAGKFPELLEAWQIAQESVEQDDIVYGLMVAFGTGGSDNESFRTLNELYNKPGAYNIKAIPNIWSSSTKASKSSFFAPSYANRSSSMDENGNTDVEEAYGLEQGTIEKMESNGADQKAINQKISERAKHPEESLLVKEGSDFPTRKINDRIHDLEADELSEGRKKVGYMRIKDGKPMFVQSASSNEIKEFPHGKNRDNEGAVVIYEDRYLKGGRVPNGLYIAGIDPYDHNKSTTSSLGSVFIMNRATRMIVAEYTGRPRKADEFYEQARLLLMYYEALANYENNLIGLKKYFEKKGSLYLLAKDLQLYKKVTKLSKVEREYGTPGTTPINNFAINKLIEWLEDKVFKNEETEYVSTIESLTLLYEMRDYEEDGNYDRISAMGMLMLLLEEYGPLGSDHEHRRKEEEEYKNKMEKEFEDIMTGSADWD